jgi:hypothetical protein
MATTTNFGWETPDDTDLVKDGAAAIRTALNGVDASFAELKGGTTGQVLSKASGTDLDFTWVAQDDSNAIQNAIVDAKGDLIVGASADTPARLPVGTNGYVLTANSSATNGVEWASAGGGSLVLVSSSTFSASSAVNVNNCFSSTYQNYRIVMQLDSASADNSQIAFRMRSSGTDSTTGYSFWGFEPNSTSVTIYSFIASSANYGAFGYQGAKGGLYTLDFGNPFAAKRTSYVCNYSACHSTLATIAGTGNGTHDVATSYDGFSIIAAAGNITGTIRVYGYANS